MSIQVTKRSRYDDVIWDYSEDYFAQKGKCNTVLKWDNFWAQYPTLCATAKAFAWSKKCGTATNDVCQWGSVKEYVMRIAVWGRILVECGMDSFADVTPENIDRLLAYLPRKRRGLKILEEVAAMYCTPNLPNLPSSDPLRGRPARTIIRQSKVKRKTPSIPEALMIKMAHRALEYEQRLPELLRLAKSKRWDTPFAESRGIWNKPTLQRELGDTQMAAIILILAGTGMRCSELLALHSRSLRCEQSPSPHWMLRGTVFKFHGIGIEAEWSCTQLGRRGFQMLRRLSPDSTSLVVSLRTGLQPSGQGVSGRLESWMEHQEWRTSAGKPYKITAHQFRPTFAQTTMLAPGMNELALKDHFHHHDLMMTDGYVGDSEVFVDNALAPYPKAQKVNWERERLLRTGALNLL